MAPFVHSFPFAPPLESQLLISSGETALHSRVGPANSTKLFRTHCKPARWPSPIPASTLSPKNPDAFGTTAWLLRRLSLPVLPRASDKVIFFRNFLPLPSMAKWSTADRRVNPMSRDRSKAFIMSARSPFDRLSHQFWQVVSCCSAFNHRSACGLVSKNIRCRVPLTFPSTRYLTSPRFVISLTFSSFVILTHLGAAENDVLPFPKTVKLEWHRVPLLGC